MSEAESDKRWIDPKGLHALRTRSRRKEPVWIAEQIRDWLSARDWDEPLRTALDPVGWARVVPPHLLDHTRVGALREGVLWIEARSPIWVQEVVLRRDELLRQIRNQGTAGLALRELRVRLGVFRVAHRPGPPVLPPLLPDAPAVRSALQEVRTGLPEAPEPDAQADAFLQQLARARASYVRTHGAGRG